MCSPGLSGRPPQRKKVDKRDAPSFMRLPGGADVTRGWKAICGLCIVLALAPFCWRAEDRAAVRAEPEARSHLYLRAATFDPLCCSASAALDLLSIVMQASPEDEALYIVQCRGPIPETWKAQLLAAGAKLGDYLPDHAYLALLDAEARHAVAGLPFVRWVGPYQPVYKLSLDFRSLSDFGSLSLLLRTFPGLAPDVVEAELQAAGARNLVRTPNSHGDYWRGELEIGQIEALAALPFVVWIEERPQPRLLNDMARYIMTWGRGDTILWDDLGLHGEGEIVAVCDSGLDTGDFATLSADFAGRVRCVFPLGDPEGGAWGDWFGHGTHVAGSLLGSGVLSGSDPPRHIYTGTLAGWAPEAELVVQALSVQSDFQLLGIPDDLNLLFGSAYAEGARIHNNSWGEDDAENYPDNPFGGYNLHAQQVDQFVWEHPAMVILFGAGNSGTDKVAPLGVVDPDSLLLPGTAKNGLTVGATESYRLTGLLGGFTWGLISFDFLRWPFLLDLVADKPWGMAAFSSRGPTDDGRLKPDLVAPGTNIISARTHHPQFNPLYTWGLHETNEHYVYNGGTSMATPLVSGAATLVRQWYRNRQGLAEPSAALIKATLINGARDLTPGQYGTGPYQEISRRPDRSQGWGLVDLAAALAPEPPQIMWYDDHRQGLVTGDVVYYGSDLHPLTVADSAQPLRVTLVWTDYPASPAAARQLVNDLDLQLSGPDGTVYQSDGSDGTSPDRLNNVESIALAAPQPGPYEIRVMAYNVPQGPQPYALVVHGALVCGEAYKVHLPFLAVGT